MLILILKIFENPVSTCVFCIGRDKKVVFFPHMIFGNCYSAEQRAAEQHHSEPGIEEGECFINYRLPWKIKWAKLSPESKLKLESSNQKKSKINKKTKTWDKQALLRRRPSVNYLKKIARSHWAIIVFDESSGLHNGVWTVFWTTVFWFWSTVFCTTVIWNTMGLQCSENVQSFCYCQALVPSPVVLDPIPNQSKIKVQLGLGWH